jgi:hypothetical protein
VLNPTVPIQKRRGLMAVEVKCFHCRDEGDTTTIMYPNLAAGEKRNLRRRMKCRFHERRMCRNDHQVRNLRFQETRVMFSSSCDLQEASTL